ncbi:hypothetical protein [Nesterenkonia marinintestina]|uniref:hypothetical protein n=1 Tax=Nesterenkonia marinintestina TaxID=2979865 RepID=UPI0021C1C505|nr:hypothetical protein [Nesterenkonia sp. GX14115]
MSRRRKSTRGNPAASSGASERARGPESGGTEPERPVGGLRAFRQAKREGRDPSVEPARRGDRSPAGASGGGAVRSNPRLLVYALVLVTLFLFAYLHLFAMPQMTYFAGGFSMPGARLGGFDVEDVERLRSVMDDDARGQLTFLHRTAGILFPVSAFLSAWASAGLLMRGKVLRWLVLAAAAVFMVVDIVKTFMIDHILGSAELSESAVATASSLTVVSWVLLVVVGALVVGSVVVDAIRRSLQENRTP